MTAPLPPALCPQCRVRRVAWNSPRIDLCYSCMPGGPFNPPPCTRCGSGPYFCQGLCERCHPGSPQYRGSCRDCLAYGVTRDHNWMCWGCRSWRRVNPVRDCPHCGRRVPVGKHGACRLCWQQALHLRRDGESFDLAAAGRHGQQLYLANLHQPRGGARQSTRPTGSSPIPARTAGFTPVSYRQYPLFWMPRNITRLKKPAALNPQMSSHCETVLRSHAAQHGWSIRQIDRVKRSLAVLQATQDTPGAVIKATDVQALSGPGITVLSTLEVLDAAGLLDDDREPALFRYFERTIAGLPEPMASQVRTWFSVMYYGSTKSPRRHPRHPQTIDLHIGWMTPALRAWAERGHSSLTGIGRDEVTTILPASGVARVTSEQGLRSLFGVLKGRKLIFANPFAGVLVARLTPNIPMPLDTQAIRSALNSADPAGALAVSLVTFHALTTTQVRHVQLTEIRDGRLILGDRTIPLAEPVRIRLAAYLRHRNGTWPETSNPYLFINRKSALRTTPPGRPFPWAGITVTGQALREDRILAEIHATGGDVRRICDLFGMSVDGALRYAAAIEHPSLTGQPHQR